MGNDLNYETLIRVLPLIAILRLASDKAADSAADSAPSNPANSTVDTIPVAQ
jgi:hypothetical protein